MATSDLAPKRGERGAVLRRMLEDDGVISEDLYAPDAVDHQPWALAAQTLGAGDGDGGESLSFASMFSDTEITIEDAVEDDDNVVVRWRLQGIHSREVWGITPTNEPVNATGQTTYRFENGKIVESWGAVDCSSLGNLCTQVVLALVGAQGVDQTDLQKIISPVSPPSPGS